MRPLSGTDSSTAVWGPTHLSNSWHGSGGIWHRLAVSGPAHPGTIAFMSHNTTLRKAAAGFYAGIGVFALVKPALVPQMFGGDAPTSESRTEIRAVYGGIPLAFALALARAGDDGPRSTGLRATVRYASYGMGLTRLVSGGFERRVRPWPTGLFAALEVAAGVALSERSNT